ncbi:hypothetical protein FM104_09385 [Microbacterium esteraromaticum]|uniref:Uncharacterized protein n=1 Tax=Microbacterium esteraromaticum TaxID=57043 RepID=A0A1R4JY53_9MICO|nr:hypothetical protein [Microbacterium esteraromaticum]SJN36908.1 hypothetical protein FM104_09385 [Microbacterium esteraromaticum]
MFRIHPDEEVRALSVEPKLVNIQTGEQKIDRDTSLPLWTVTALHQPSDGSRPKLVKVTVPSKSEPDFTPMFAGFDRLEVDEYSIKRDGGGLSNAGLWFRAASLIELEG